MIVPGQIKVTNTSTGQDADISKLVATPNSLEGVKDGIYPVELVYPSDDSSKEDAILVINIVVIDENRTIITIDGKDFLLISADDIYMDKSAEDFVEDDYNGSSNLVKLSNAKLVDLETKEEAVDKEVMANPSAVGNYKAEIYDMEYVHEEYSTIAKLFVKDDSSVVGEDNVVLNASGFAIEVGTVLGEVDVLDQSNASAFNETSLEELEVELVNPTELAVLNSGETGVYPITVGVVGSDTERVIYVTVYGEDDILGESVLLAASNFVIRIEDVVSIEMATVVSLSEASAIDRETGNSVAVEVSSEDVKMLQESEIGFYEVVVFATNPRTNEKVEKTIVVSVIGENTEVGSEEEEEDEENVFLNAEDGVVTNTGEETITEEDLIEAASAIAWTDAGVDLTGEVTVITSVDLEDITDETSIEVTFIVEVDGVTVEVTVTIMINHMSLDHSRAKVHVDDLPTVSLVELFKLRVLEGEEETTREDYDKENAKFTVLNTSESIRKLDAGVYEVNISVGNIESVETLVVYDDNSVFNEDDTKVLYLDSNYVLLSSDEAVEMTFEHLLEITNARGYDLETKEELPVNLVNESIMTEINNGEKGIYDVNVKVNPEAIIVVEVEEGLQQLGYTNYMLYALLLLLLAYGSRKVVVKFGKKY